MSELLLLLPKVNSLAIISKKFLWLYRNFPLLEKAVIEEWDKRQREVHKDDINIESKISQLKTQALLTVEKIKMLTSEVAIKYMEEELVKIELQIAELQVEKEKWFNHHLLT
jgi:peptidoglycan hydrolase CwlO-like protein